MRRLLVIASAAVLGTAALVPLAVGGPQAAVAGEPLTVGRTKGTIECHSYLYETSSGQARTPKMPCDRTWTIDVVNAPEWEFDETRSFSAQARNGISYAQTISQKASYTMTLDPDGVLQELVLAAELSTTVSHAGNTSVELDLDIPIPAGTEPLRIQDSLEVGATGHDNFFARSVVDVSLECGERSAGNRLVRQRSRDFGNETDSATPRLDTVVEPGPGDCVLHVLARISARNSDIIKSDHDAQASAKVDLTVGPAPCVLSGLVLDGDALLDGHENPMSGIRVTAEQDGSPVGEGDVTGSAGRYCLRDIEAGDYELVASLIYETHDPPIFETLYATALDPEETRRAVVEQDFARDDVDVVFSSTPERPWRADAANIHWQSTRFVDWVIQSGIATTTQLDAFTIVVQSGDTSSNYDQRTQEIHLKDRATPYAIRETGMSHCPENCEWHEIAHHVGDQIGVAPTLNSACLGRHAAHGGWRNSETCDSVGEGFATFLAVLCSLTLDAGRGPEYATSDYSDFGSLETNGSVPWFIFEFEGRVYGREDFAVSELLWDLIDPSPAEPAAIDLVVPFESIDVVDAVALDGPALVRLMAESNVMTVVDLYTALLDSDLVPKALKESTIELDADRAHDVSPLAAVFLVHGFHPVHDIGNPWYTLGDPISVTNRQAISIDTGRPVPSSPPGATSPRSTMIELPRAAVELVNSTAAEVTYQIDITYPETTSRRSVTVDAGARVVTHLELPPYWRTFAAPGELPPCGAPTDHVATMTISGGGAAPLTVTSCEYWKAIAATTTDHALTYPVDAANPGPSGGPAASAGPDGSPVADPSSPSVLLVAGGAVLIVVLGVLFLLLGRRRRNRPAS